MNIVVLDRTVHWAAVLPVACQRWSAALASRGIVLSYATLGGAGVGVILVREEGARSDLLGFGEWSAVNGVWDQGVVTFYGTPDRELVSMHVALHELGHAMQLVPPDTGHASPGSDSVMTIVPRLVHPSAWDAANVFGGTPVDVPVPEPWVPPPAPPPRSDRKKKKGKKRKKR